MADHSRPNTGQASKRLESDELLVERAALNHIGKAHRAYLEHTRQVAAGLAAEAAEAIDDGIRDIVDEDAEADAAVQAVLVRQMSERAMYAARRVADLEAQGEALAFGKLVDDEGQMVYVGRRTVFDGDEPLLIDWRARAAVPFYRATPLEPMGQRQRRHLHYDENVADPTLIDYSDEVFDPDRLSSVSGLNGSDDSELRGEAALLATLVAPTGEQMRSVVATIQAEQDAVIRSAGNKMLVVQGGPGTGKTVVALHRAAYLLYDQRVDLADTGVLIVGPSNQFLRYISGVLPSLGESGVVSVTVPRLYRGVRLGADEEPMVSALKANPTMVQLLAAAVRLRQRRPKERFVTWYGSRRVVIDLDELNRLFDRSVRQALHNDGAALFRRELMDNLIYQVYDPTFHNLDDARESFEGSEQLTEFFLRHFPALSPEQALNDLFGSKSLIREAAELAGLDPIGLEVLYRDRRSERNLDRRQWSNADAALLDELLHLLGPVIPDGQRLSIEQAEDEESWVVRDETDAFELAQSTDDDRLPSIDPYERVGSPEDVDGPIAYDDPYFDDPNLEDVDEIEAEEGGSEISLSTIAADEEDDGNTERQRSSIETALAAEGRSAPEYDGAPAEALDLQAVDAADDVGATVVELVGQERSWQFGHVIVDEAQDLTPMQWRMVARRAGGGGLTVVGDLAQRVGTPAASWSEVIPPELSRYDLRQLTINYRSPAEIDNVARSLLAHIAPELPLARSLRRSGRRPMAIHSPDPKGEALRRANAESAANPTLRVACITDNTGDGILAGNPANDRVTILTPLEAKGLEFDVVYLIEPAEMLRHEFGLNLLYVAVTRATQALVVVHQHSLPDVLVESLDQDGFTADEPVQIEVGS